MLQIDIPARAWFSSSPGKAEGRTRGRSPRKVLSRMRFAYPGYVGSGGSGAFSAMFIARFVRHDVLLPYLPAPGKR